MPGAPDPLYIAARRVLLDALHALRDHIPAIVLVGAQAVYLHAGEGDLAVAPFTTDGDLALDPRRLGPEPLLEQALGREGFRPGAAVGHWERSIDVEGVQRTVAVDLLVPESLGGAGRRGARIPPHAKTVARKAIGLEATLADYDALDVYRLLRALPTGELVRRFRVLLADETARGAAAHALEEFPRLFGSASAVGVGMAVRAAVPLERGDTLAASFAVLTNDLIDEMRKA